MSTHHRTRSTALITAAGASLALAVSTLAPTTAGAHPDHHDDLDLTPVAELMSPRGVDALGYGKTLVTEQDGTFSIVVERDGKPAKVHELGRVSNFLAPAVAAGPRHTVWLLTTIGGGPEEENGAHRAPLSKLRTANGVVPNGEPEHLPQTLFKWKPGWPHPKPVADIAAYQQTDPDPYDQEDFPEDSNPFGLAALKDGSVLVADAAGNDLLRVWPRSPRAYKKHGNPKIVTVARLKPRLVETPEGLPGDDFPPAGTPILSEAVATSITVGRDGYWYVGELRGFPATEGKSQVWRIRPGVKNAVCDPERPWRNWKCKRFADGLTSIVDLATTKHGVLALSLSQLGWLKWELGVPGSEIGGLFHIRYWGKHGHGHGPRIQELLAGMLPNPGGVDATRKAVYITAPIFGPGFLWKVTHDHD
ncbi:ScyD/ScyE family protein [Nocardioides sp. GCM10027113]|uniref:ScyD/ScyE family protein n=1 Tax=unclassified Nocardioides TaxID=2615069 RepID=UPI00360A9EA4